ncbi:hypothetical protein BGZ81_011602 [Podila clonocystis]|nr:hypothetical protein BGZ81_011602 [Podila clonocystis]
MASTTLDHESQHAFHEGSLRRVQSFAGFPTGLREEYLLPRELPAAEEECDTMVKVAPRLKFVDYDEQIAGMFFAWRDLEQRPQTTTAIDPATDPATNPAPDPATNPAPDPATNPATATATATPKQKFIMKDDNIHYFGGHGNRCACVTEERAHKRSPLEIVVGGTHGFIPLWAKDVVLRYRFDERTLQQSGRTKEEILELFNKAISQWGDAVPVAFIESSTAWDFEFVVSNNNDYYEKGCVLASAFFPGGGQQKLVIYPMIFNQHETGQVETLVHELGHVFGLHHWIAKDEDEESDWKLELFGTQDPFTIMNYGEESTLTDTDKMDLKLLYKLAWSGELKNINNTPIVLFKPFSAHAPQAHQR